MHTIAVANLKGGTAKTTTAHSLAAALAEKNRRALLVDLDPHGGLSRWCNVREDTAWREALALGRDPTPAIRPAGIVGVDLLPSCTAMATLPLRPTQLTAVGDALAHVQGYDLAIIDCPPNFGLPVLAAIVAAQVVLCPVEASFLALEGLEYALATLGDLDRQGHPRPAWFLVCRYTHTRVSTAVLAELRETLGRDVFTATIRQTTRIQEAPEAGISILEHSPDCTASADYRAAADELLQRIAHHGKRKA